MKTATTIIIVGIGVAAAVIGGMVALSIYQQQQQQAQAQEQHFQDCKGRILDVSNRMSQLIDRANSIGGAFDFSGDIRAEASANMNELSRINGDCSDVSERLQQDSAIRYQMDYINQQLRNYGIIQ